MRTRARIITLGLWAQLAGLPMLSGVPACSSEPVAAANGAPFKVDAKGGSVTLGKTSGPTLLKFDTGTAEMGTPLPRPPVTGRVTTVEALTSPAFAPLEGRIERVAVRLSDKVEKGSKLALIKSAELANLQKDLRSARLSIRTKTWLTNGLEQLTQSRAVPQRDLLVTKAELEESKLNARAASARLEALSIGLDTDDRYWLLASQPGTVVQLNVVPGQRVGPGNEKAVATVAELNEVLVLADVVQSDAPGLAPGQRVKVSIGTGTGEDQSAEGKIDAVSDVVDADRQTVPVRVRVPNPNRLLRPNAFVRVEFLPEQTTGTEQALRVPTSAVVHDGLTAIVFVEKGKGNYKRHPVVVGRHTREWTEVRSGLNVGERVVTKGALLLLNAIELERG
jgi:cobalt-zinc-cadmium efflux system membrane fusion protein